MLLALALLAAPAATLLLLVLPMARHALRRRATAGTFAGFGEEAQAMLAAKSAPANRLPTPTLVWRTPAASTLPVGPSAVRLARPRRRGPAPLAARS